MAAGDERPQNSDGDDAEDSESWYFDLPSGAWERQEAKNRELRQRVLSNLDDVPQRNDPFARRPQPEAKKGGLFGLGKKKEPDAPRETAGGTFRLARGGASPDFGELEPVDDDDADSWSTELPVEPPLRHAHSDEPIAPPLARGYDGDVPEPPLALVRDWQEEPEAEAEFDAEPPSEHDESAERPAWPFARQFGRADSAPGAQLAPHDGGYTETEWEGNEADYAVEADGTPPVTAGFNRAPEPEPEARSSRWEDTFGTGDSQDDDEGALSAMRAWARKPEPGEEKPRSFQLRPVPPPAPEEAAPEPALDAAHHPEPDIAPPAPVTAPKLSFVRRSQDEPLDIPETTEKWDEMFDAAPEPTGGLSLMAEWAKHKPWDGEGEMPEELLKPFDWEEGDPPHVEILVPDASTDDEEPSGVSQDAPAALVEEGSHTDDDAQDAEPEAQEPAVALAVESSPPEPEAPHVEEQTPLAEPDRSLGLFDWEAEDASRRDFSWASASEAAVAADTATEPTSLAPVAEAADAPRKSRGLGRLFGRKKKAAEPEAAAQLDDTTAAWLPIDEPAAALPPSPSVEPTDAPGWSWIEDEAGSAVEETAEADLSPVLEDGPQFAWEGGPGSAPADEAGTEPVAGLPAGLWSWAVDEEEPQSLESAPPEASAEDELPLFQWWTPRDDLPESPLAHSQEVAEPDSETDAPAAEVLKSAEDSADERERTAEPEPEQQESPAAWVLDTDGDAEPHGAGAPPADALADELNSDPADHEGILGWQTEPHGMSEPLAGLADEPVVARAAGADLPPDVEDSNAAAAAATSHCPETLVPAEAEGLHDTPIADIEAEPVEPLAPGDEVAHAQPPFDAEASPDVLAPADTVAPQLPADLVAPALDPVLASPEEPESDSIPAEATVWDDDAGWDPEPYDGIAIQPADQDAVPGETAALAAFEPELAVEPELVPESDLDHQEPAAEVTAVVAATADASLDTDWLFAEHPGEEEAAESDFTDTPVASVEPPFEEFDATPAPEPPASTPLAAYSDHDAFEALEESADDPWADFLASRASVAAPFNTSLAAEEADGGGESSPDSWPDELEPAAAPEARVVEEDASGLAPAAGSGTPSAETDDPWAAIAAASGYDSVSPSGAAVYRAPQPQPAEPDSIVASLESKLAEADAREHDAAALMPQSEPWAYEPEEPQAPAYDDVVLRAFEAHAATPDPDPVSPPTRPGRGVPESFASLLGDDAAELIEADPAEESRAFQRLQGWAPQKTVRSPVDPANAPWEPEDGEAPPAWDRSDDEAAPPPPWGAELAEDGEPTPVPVVARSKTRTLVRELVETGLLALLVFLAVRASFQNFKVDGSSMYPTLHDGQFLIVNKLVYSEINVDKLSNFIPFVNAGNDPDRNVFHGPERGDIVVLVDPRKPDTDLIKRVIGLPGDTLQIVDGHVYINDHLLEEPYIKTPWHDNKAKTLIPDGEYFVMGDNRDNSLDSRSPQVGLIPRDLIIGKAMVSYWPKDTFGLAPNQSPTISATDTVPQEAALQIDSP